MVFKLCAVLSTLTVVTLAQRSPYAGHGPIGYPAISSTTTTSTTPAPSQMDNRFGEPDAPQTTTMRLPPDAMGDRRLVEFLSRLPIEQQPFWFINWKAIQAQRERPQTYEQKPNFFIGPFPGQSFQNFS